MLEQELIEAIESNSLARVQELLAAGANPNARKGKRSALELVHHRRDDLLCALIEAGADGRGQGLVWAARTGRLATVEALIAQGADVNMVAPSGTPLQVACALGHLEVAERLLRAGADPDAGSSISTPLLSALDGGHDRLALALLGAGANPRHTPRFGRLPPLVLAAEQGRDEVLQALLEAGADPDEPGPLKTDRVKAPPLLAAILGGHARAVRRLLAAGALVDKRDSQGRAAFELANTELRALLAEFGVTSERRTPAEQLLLAAQQGEAATLRSLLDDGAPIEARDQRRATQGWTPLMLAARGGHREAVQTLLHAGADPALLDGPPDKAARWIGQEAGEDALAGVCLGRPALTRAVEGAHLEVACALLEAGAPVEVKDALGWTPFLLACQAGHLELVRVLAEKGADLKKKGPGGATALELATHGGHRAVVDFLLQRSKGRPAGSALVAACEVGDGQLVERLLAAGADPNQTSRSKQTPLVAAVSACRWHPLEGTAPTGAVARYSERGAEALLPLPGETVVPIVEALLRAGADPGRPGLMGPPLMEAARSGQLEAARKLAAAGADPAQAHEGATALSVARLYERQEMVRWLESLGAAEAPPSEPLAPKREPRSVPVPSFKTSRAFRAARGDLAARCGSQPSEEAPGLYRVHVQTQCLPELKLEELQGELSPRGCFVCWDSSRKSALLAAATKDPFEVIAAVQTDGCNCSLGTGDILDWLRELQAEQPFVLTMIAPDSLGGRFLEPVRDPKGLARRMYAFCPDIVDQGCGTVQELARQLKKSDQLFFWWD